MMWMIGSHVRHLRWGRMAVDGDSRRKHLPALFCSKLMRNDCVWGKVEADGGNGAGDVSISPRGILWRMWIRVGEDRKKIDPDQRSRTNIWSRSKIKIRQDHLQFFTLLSCLLVYDHLYVKNCTGYPLAGLSHPYSGLERGLGLFQAPLGQSWTKNRKNNKKR